METYETPLDPPLHYRVYNVYCKNLFYLCISPSHVGVLFILFDSVLVLVNRALVF